MYWSNYQNWWVRRTLSLCEVSTRKVRKRLSGYNPSTNQRRRTLTPSCSRKMNQHHQLHTTPVVISMLREFVVMSRPTPPKTKNEHQESGEYLYIRAETRFFNLNWRTNLHYDSLNGQRRKPMIQFNKTEVCQFSLKVPKAKPRLNGCGMNIMTLRRIDTICEEVSERYSCQLYTIEIKSK